MELYVPTTSSSMLSPAYDSNYIKYSIVLPLFLAPDIPNLPNGLIDQRKLANSFLVKKKMNLVMAQTWTIIAAQRAGLTQDLSRLELNAVLGDGWPVLNPFHYHHHFI